MRSAEIPAGTAPAVVTSVWPAARCATSAAARWSSSSLNTSSSSSTGGAADDLGAQPVAGEPQRERERALLALRRVRAAVEAVERAAATRRGAGPTSVTPRSTSRRARATRARRAAPSTSTGRASSAPVGPLGLVAASTIGGASPASAAYASRDRGREPLEQLAAGRATSSRAGRARAGRRTRRGSRGVLGVAEAAAQQRVALLQHPLVVGARRRVPRRDRDEQVVEVVAPARRARPSPAARSSGANTVTRRRLEQVARALVSGLPVDAAPGCGRWRGSRPRAAAPRSSSTTSARTIASSRPVRTSARVGHAAERLCRSRPRRPPRAGSSCPARWRPRSRCTPGGKRERRPPRSSGSRSARGGAGASCGRAQEMRTGIRR